MAESAREERVEAVIISGPRKGELITLNGESEPHLTAEEEAMLDLAVRMFRQAAESATAASASMDSLLGELREVNRKLHEPIGSSG